MILPEGIHPFTICGESLELRVFSAEHLRDPSYLHWMNDPEVTATIGRPEYLRPVSMQMLEAYVASLQDCIFLAIHAGTDLEFCGTLKIYDLDSAARRGAIGILVGKRQSWGTGIGTRAVNAACRYMHGRLGVNKIWAGYLKQNTGMARVFERCGFVVEGVLKQHVFAAGELSDVVHVARFREDV